MAESSASTVRAFHLVMRDNEEGGLHYAYETEPYFALPSELVEALGAPVGDFAHDFVSGAYQNDLLSNPDDVGMAPWFEVEELPSGSTVPQLIESKSDFEDYLLKGYRHACCIGWE